MFFFDESDLLFPSTVLDCYYEFYFALTVVDCHRGRGMAGSEIGGQNFGGGKDGDKKIGN